MVTPIAEVDREIAAAFADLMNSNDTVDIHLSEQAESEESALQSLLAGSADIALVSGNMPYQSDIATVMPFYPTVLHIGYAVGRDISSGQKLLQGARVYAGATGSASRQMFENITDRLELTADDYSYVEGGDEVPDVYVVFAPISPERLAQFPGFRLYSLGSPDDIGTGSLVDAATLLDPQLHAFVIPAGTYDEATPEAVVTLAVDMLLVARRGLDETVVYDLVKNILALRPALAAIKPGSFQELTDNFDTGRSPFVLHPGLLAYMQRDAPSVYERYSGVAEVAVTLFVALASAIIAGMRIYRVRRKNRIDVFYKEAIAIRDSVDELASREDRLAASRRVGDLQTRAFDMLIDEQLAADESFRIFITLSNDVIKRLESDLQHGNARPV